MDADFEDFVEALATPAPSQSAPHQPFERVAILGGGEDARLLAALCLAAGADVSLFSAYGHELEGLQGGIALRGAGPVGAYQVNQPGIPSIKTTSALDDAVAQADLLFLTGPVHKQRTYAMVLADHLRDGQVLVLPQARSMGALEATWLLQIGGARADITLVEVQGLPYWTEAQGSTLQLAPVGKISAATLPNNRPQVLEGLKRFLPNIEPALSVIHSSFADGSGLVEAPALLLGGVAVQSGAPAVPMGGVPLAENQNFRTLIGPEQETIISKLTQERHQVAQRFGIRDLPTAASWMQQYAGAATGEGRRAIPSYAQAHALLRDAAIGSLVPLVSAAQIAGCVVPTTQAMIDLISAILGADVATAGRKLQNIGVVSSDINTARQHLESIAKGERF